MANALPIKAGHLFIGLAIIMGLGTMMIFMSLGKKSKSSAKVEQAKIETQQIVVPMATIFQGEVIDREDIKAVAWPKDFLPVGQTFDSTMDVIGRVAKQDLLPGEPIFIEKVTGPESAAGMPAVIPSGHRAVTVAVSEVKAVAGFVKPGDRVDVLVTFMAPVSNGEPERVTKTVLQNVLVLAAAQTMTEDNGESSIEPPPGVVNGEVSVESEAAVDDAGGKKSRRSSAAEKKKSEAKAKAEEKKAAKEAEKERARREKARREAEKKAKNISSVTLAVTPEQAQVVTMAEETGELRLVLRPDTDNAVVDVPSTMSNDILTTPSGMRLAEPEPMPDLTVQTPVMPPGRTVEVIQGTNRSTVNF